jgi:Cys-tRNA(Pro)/Cys-tRNA(Cys) deacylase
VSAGATPAIDIVRRAGVVHTIHEYELPERHGRDREARPSYGLEAAAALGVEPGRMFKTLVANVDDGLVLAVVPVDRELDLKRLAAAVGGRRAVIADPAAAERAWSSVGSARSAPGGRWRSWRTSPSSTTKRSSCRPGGAVSSSSSCPRTWCV